MDIFEHSGAPALITLLDEISRDANASWGIARIKKNYLRPVTDEAFLFAIRSALQDADIAHIFFIDQKRIFVAWHSTQKSVYRHLRSLISASLVRVGVSIEASTLVAYISPSTSGEHLRAALKAPEGAADRLFDKAENFPVPADIDTDTENPPEKTGNKQTLVATPAQIEQLREMRSDKPYRKQLQLLVVEDQTFSQKLLCEILRSARVRNNNETPLIDAVMGIQEAWKTYLKKLPDLTFVDLNLVDGSGHTLARAIKELDPASCVIIVTANNYEEEQIVAKQNNVDGFISKPYNKKQIFECIEKYINGQKASLAGGRRGTTGQF